MVDRPENFTRSGGMRHYDIKDTPVKEVQELLLGGVAPRPVALVSTLSADGVRNLSPFSFFNAFGSNPPTVCVSPSRRGRDASIKHTYQNLLETGECTIQAVTYEIVQQVSLASTEYPQEVDEFIKTGLTPIPSDIVKPPRVAESPFQMECRLKQMIPLGDGRASGNLAVCEVLCFHVAEDIFRDGIIQPDLIDLCGRMSGDYYCRASGEAVFKIKKPIETKGIGYDQLPAHIRNSDVLSANNLGQLGNTERIPNAVEIEEFIKAAPVIEATEQAFRRLQRKNDYKNMLGVALFLAQAKHPKALLFFEVAAKAALDSANDTDFAWKTLLYAEVAWKQTAFTNQSI